jgi:hypothetical protein
MITANRNHIIPILKYAISQGIEVSFFDSPRQTYGGGPTIQVDIHKSLHTCRHSA